MGDVKDLEFYIDKNGDVGVGYSKTDEEGGFQVVKKMPPEMMESVKALGARELNALKSSYAKQFAKLCVLTAENVDLKARFEEALKIISGERKLFGECRSDSIPQIPATAVSLCDEDIDLRQQLTTLQAEKEQLRSKLSEVAGIGKELEKRLAYQHEQTEIMTEARNRFCSEVGQIAVALGFRERDSYAPEAVLRKAKELQAEKERLERNECPHCDGGEVYVGSSFPDDEGFATCETCEGSALLPNADDIRIMRNKLREMQGDLQAYEQGQIPAYQDRIKELEGELGRLREHRSAPA